MYSRRLSSISLRRPKVLVAPLTQCSLVSVLESGMSSVACLYWVLKVEMMVQISGSGSQKFNISLSEHLFWEPWATCPRLLCHWTSFTSPEDFRFPRDLDNAYRPVSGSPSPGQYSWRDEIPDPQNLSMLYKGFRLGTIYWHSVTDDENGSWVS